MAAKFTTDLIEEPAGQSRLKRLIGQRTPPTWQIVSLIHRDGSGFTRSGTFLIKICRH